MPWISVILEPFKLFVHFPLQVSFGFQSFYGNLGRRGAGRPHLAARAPPTALFALGKNENQGPYHLHGKTGNFDLNINWSASFRLERSVNYRSPVGEIHILYSFQ